MMIQWTDSNDGQDVHILFVPHADQRLTWSLRAGRCVAWSSESFSQVGAALADARQTLRRAMARDPAVSGQFDWVQ